jgi:hypothetical protein
VLRHLGLLARLARRHGGRSRVSRGAAWSGASPTSSSRVRSRSAEARRLRVTPKRGAARRAAAPMRENLGTRDETTRSGSSRTPGGVSDPGRANFPRVFLRVGRL